jgi:hypothetical protein
VWTLEFSFDRTDVNPGTPLSVQVNLKTSMDQTWIPLPGNPLITILAMDVFPFTNRYQSKNPLANQNQEISHQNSLQE